MRVTQARSTQPAEQPVKTQIMTPPCTTGTSTQGPQIISSALLLERPHLWPGTMHPKDGKSRCPKRRNIFKLRRGCLPQKIAMNHALVGNCEFLIPFFPRLYWLQIQTTPVNQRRRIKNILSLSLSTTSSSGSSRYLSISREGQAEWLGQTLPFVERNSWTRRIRTWIFLPAKRDK
jgi:hypothetical protein